jgi:hypothetical protein
VIIEYGSHTYWTRDLIATTVYDFGGNFVQRVSFIKNNFYLESHKLINTGNADRRYIFILELL